MAAGFSLHQEFNTSYWKKSAAKLWRKGTYFPGIRCLTSAGNWSFYVMSLQKIASKLPDMWSFFPPVVYLKFIERVSDKITCSCTITEFPFNWLAGLSTLKTNNKIQETAVLTSWSRVFWWSNILESAAKIKQRKCAGTNVFFSNYSRSQPSFRGLCYSNDLVTQNFLILRRSRFDMGLVQARMFSSSGFTRLFNPEFCNRNAISWLRGFDSNNNLQMCKALYKKGKVWESDLTNASVRSLLSPCFLSLCQDVLPSLSVLLVNPGQEQGQKLALYSVSTLIL